MTQEVLYFGAPWCGPCRPMSLVFSQLDEENLEVVFNKINVDTQADITLQYRIKSVPTIIRLEDGIETARIVGAKTYKEIVKILGL